MPVVNVHLKTNNDTNGWIDSAYIATVRCLQKINSHSHTRAHRKESNAFLSQANCHRSHTASMYKMGIILDDTDESVSNAQLCAHSHKNNDTTPITTTTTKHN